MRLARPPLAALLALLVAAPGISAQDAFLDDGARILHAAARARWREIDRSLIRYQAVVSQRLGVGLRMPLRDRSLVSHESAARVIWERGAEGERSGVTAVQMLALRGRLPDDEEDHDGRRRCEGSSCAGAAMDGLFLRGFQPSGDPLMLGIARWDDDDEDRFEHPFADGAETHYRFRSGDTLTVSLPDGRALRTVELMLLPRRDDPHLLSGKLWVEPETGALVRAAYRMARPFDVIEDANEVDDDVERLPGLLRPFVVEITLVAVDYALWDFRLWMPRSIRVEGTVRVGIVSAPVAGEIAYEIEEVVTTTDPDTAGVAPAPLGMDASVERLAALAGADGGGWRIQSGEGRRGRRMRYLIPEDRAVLEGSPHLPEPIWNEDGSFVSRADVEALGAMLAQLPPPEQVTTVANFDWGIQRPELVRYNRVEGVSVGARGSMRFGLAGAPLSAVLTARLGSADLEPRGTLALTHETLSRSLTLSAYRELQLVEPGGRGLGIGNSVMAFLFGRDDGDYFQATGAALGVTPPVAERAWYRARVYLERQDAAARETNESVLRWVDVDEGFRPGFPGFRADQLGVEVTLSPWWGVDPTRPGGGLDVSLQAEEGDFDFRRVRAGVHGTLPLVAGSRLALSARGGTTWGDPPPQRLWVLGGPYSLRGFAPGVRFGPSFLSGRAELVVPLSRVPAARSIGLAVFTDGGWAGDRGRIRWDGAVASAGVGLSILDGILRLDAAWGWHGPEGRRLDLYLDGLL